MEGVQTLVLFLINSTNTHDRFCNQETVFKGIQTPSPAKSAFSDLQISQVNQRLPNNNQSTGQPNETVFPPKPRPGSCSRTCPQLLVRGSAQEALVELRLHRLDQSRCTKQAGSAT